MVNHSRFLGYTKDKDGNLVIVPEEAQLVRRICKLYLEGNSSYRIKRILEAEGIPTVTGKKTWSATTIDRMLSNEKYMGDALLQKTYTVDFLTKKKVKNNGIVPQYYICLLYTSSAAKDYLLRYHFYLQKLIEAKDFEKLELLKEAANAVSGTLEERKQFQTYVTELIRLIDVYKRQPHGLVDFIL